MKVTAQDLSLITLAFAIYVAVTYNRRRKSAYPPGPRGLPILGIVREHPRTEYWKTYAEWGRVYGSKGIISFHVLGRRIIVLNSASAAIDMLDKNSAIYSDRPFSTMFGVLMRREKSIFSIKYGERFKAYRKLMSQDFNRAASQKYWGVQEAEARLLAMNIMKKPEVDQLEKHLRKYAAAVIMHIAYGYTVKDSDDNFVAMAEESMRVASIAVKPGWLVDSIPILRFIPPWFPGGKFRRLADEWSEKIYTQILIPFNLVKQQMAEGTAKPSFASLHLQNSQTEEDEDTILWTAGALYGAAADTTASAVKTFFLLMCLYPDVQRRAQAEIDRVVGHERLPSLTDRAQLSYVNNVISEVFRWGPPAPLGLPHSPAKDDIFSGYIIPQGCIILANIWSLMRDESVYADPHVFNPDRFDALSGKPEPDPRQWLFGFGRRVCPGKEIAETSVFIQVATILATVDILRDVDEKGEEILPDAVFSSNVVSYVESFPCKLVPRSKECVTLVQNVVDGMDL